MKLRLYCQVVLYVLPLLLYCRALPTVTSSWTTSCHIHMHVPYVA
jgi:hypothetical protein